MCRSKTWMTPKLATMPGKPAWHLWTAPTSWSASVRARKKSTSCAARSKQAEGELAFTRTQLDATVIRAPVTGTILERNVEVGEFITTSFVGERGAKGFVVSLADLNDLQVELDISQDDFAKLTMGQSAVVATDAFPIANTRAPSSKCRPKPTARKPRFR